LAFVVWHPDMNNHIDWGIRFFEYGPAKYFAPETNVWSFTWPNQPLGTIYMFAGIRKLFEIIFSFFWWINVNVSLFPSGIVSYFETNLYPALLQLPSILADMGIAYLIYKIIEQRTENREQRGKNKNQKIREKMGILGATLFLINPATWYNSAVWGQYDSVINFLVLLSFYLVFKKKLMWAIFAFSLSLFTKLSLVIFLPIFAIIIAKQKYSGKILAKSILVSVVFFGLVTLPFSQGEPFSWLYWLYTKKVLVQQLQVITANAFNLWAGLTGIHEQPHSLMLGPFSYQIWGYILFVIAYVPILISVFKKQDKETVFWALALTAFSVFMLLTNMHERYLYPFFPAFTILAAKNTKLMPYYWGISAISLINLYNFWWMPKIGALVSIMSYGDRLMPRVLGFIAFYIFVRLYLKHFRHLKLLRL